MESGRAWQPAGRSFRDGGGGRVYIIIARLGANQASTYLDSLLSALKLFGVNHGKFFSTTTRWEAGSKRYLAHFPLARVVPGLAKILWFGHDGDKGPLLVANTSTLLVNWFLIACLSCLNLRANFAIGCSNKNADLLRSLAL